MIQDTMNMVSSGLATSQSSMLVLGNSPQSMSSSSDNAINDKSHQQSDHSPNSRMHVESSTDSSAKREDDFFDSNFDLAKQLALLKQFQLSTDYSNLQDRCRDLLEIEKIIKAREEQINSREIKLQNITEDLTKQQNSTFYTKARQALVTSLQKKGQYDRKEARDEWTENIKVYGRVDIEGGIFSEQKSREVWYDGQKAFEIKKKQEQIDSQKESLKKRRANMRRTKGKSQISSEVENELQRELGNYIATSEKELASEAGHLRMMKSLHVLESKRIKDEDMSRFKDFPILKDRYLLLKLLGKGPFSEVFEAFDIKTLVCVSCKIHIIEPTWSESKKVNFQRSACRQYLSHKSLNHKHLAQFLDIFDIDAHTFCAVTEFCPGGDLDIHLRKYRTTAVKEARIIIAQIFEGLLYLYQQNRPIVHYALKPANVLFDDLGLVKLTDFGIYKALFPYDEPAQVGYQLDPQGPFDFLAPECRCNTDVYPIIPGKVDVWSVGVLLYLMLFGYHPYGTEMTPTVARNILNGNLHFEFPTKPIIPAFVKEFIVLSLTPDPEKRPDLETLSKHEFVTFTPKKINYSPLPNIDSPISQPSQVSSMNYDPEKNLKRPRTSS